MQVILILFTLFALVMAQGGTNCLTFDCNQLESKHNCIQSCCCLWCNTTSTCNNVDKNNCPKDSATYTCNIRNAMIIVAFTLAAIFGSCCLLVLCCVLIGRYSQRRDYIPLE